MPQTAPSQVSSARPAAVPEPAKAIYSRASRHRRFCSVMLGICILSLTGCGNRSALTARSIERGIHYVTMPTSAYYHRTAEGGYEVVLLHDPLDVQPQRTAAGIAPAVEPPLRQVVHLRILWRPRRIPQQREQLAANASIDWRLFGVGLEGGEDHLHYQGAGFVTIDESGDSARVLIRRALIKPVSSGGRLADPLGPSEFSGSVIAQRDRNRVDRIVGQLRQSVSGVAAAEQDVIRHSGPPPRQPIQP
jgi:hypothetical protein